MHLLDMYTREKANQLHLDKMRRDRPYRSLLRGANSTRNVANAKWMWLVLIFATLILLPSTFLIPSMGGFKPMNLGAGNDTLI
jgi:hypothetical protein